jgi:hypothetical protein
MWAQYFNRKIPRVSWRKLYKIHEVFLYLLLYTKQRTRTGPLAVIDVLFFCVFFCILCALIFLPLHFFLILFSIIIDFYYILLFILLTIFSMSTFVSIFIELVGAPSLKHHVMHTHSRYWSVCHEYITERYLITYWIIGLT